MTPAKVDDAPWLVRTAALGPPLVTVPLPLSELTVWLKPPRSRVAPLLTVVTLAALNAFTAPPISVPALIVVPPE